MLKTNKVLFAALLLAPAPARAARTGAAPAAWLPKVPAPLSSPLPGDPLKATIHRLPNGLTIYLSPNHERPRIAAWIAVRAGSKNDPAATTGLAHYLEHMLFKGTSTLGTLNYAEEKPHLDRILELYEKHFKATDPKERAAIYRQIDAENISAGKYEIPNEFDKIYHELGFEGLNAFTSNEETIYVVDMPSNRAEAWAKVESARFAQPVFRLFQGELEAVYEEKNRSLDNAEHILGEALNKQLYKVHPYGQQTKLGTIEHLKNPSLARMYEFYARNYIPNNMAIVMSGDFETEAMLALLKRYFSAWTPKPLPEPKTWPLPKPKGAERVEVKYEAEEKVVIAWPTVPLGHPDADALSVMDMLMDNSVAGIINLTLTQAQKVKAAGSGPSFYNEAGDWSVWAVPKRGQTLEQAEALLLEAVEKLKAGDFTDEEIKAVITNFEVSEKSRLESNQSRVEFMASSFVHLEPWEKSVERLSRLRKVTKEDVLRVARKYVGADRVVAYRRNGKPELPSIAKPNFTKLTLDDARRSRFASEILALPVKPIEPRWLALNRDYTVVDLPEGRLYAAKNPFNDLFSLSLVFDRGRRQERALCAALELLELAGAGALTAEEYKKKLFGLGTSIGYSCGEQESAVSVSGLNENLWPSLELMEKRFAAPNLAADTLKKMVDVAIGAHQDSKKDPGAIRGALGEFARRGKDSAVLNELSDKELLALKDDALKTLLHDALNYRHRIGYVGNRPPGELAKLLESGRKFKEPPARLPLRLKKPKEPAIYFTHRDMVQSQVGLSAADEIFDPARYVDYAYYSAYMGGGMSSVIFQEVREARSLAYSAGGGYVAAGHKGDENELHGGLGCQADKTIEAAELLGSLMKSPPLSEPRFREAAKAIEQNYRANPVPFRSIPSTLIEWEDQGIQGDPEPERFEKSLKYTLADFKSFSDRFKDKPLTFYILGHRDRVGLGELKKLGRFEEKTLEELFPY